MALFGVQNYTESFRGDSTEHCGRAGNWNVDMTNPGDSQVANKTNTAMPVEFGSQFGLYDSCMRTNPVQIAMNLQFEMKMMIQIMDRVMQYLEAMLRAQAGSQSGYGSGSDGGTRSGADGATKSGSDGGTKSGSDGGTKSGSDGGTKSGSDGGTRSGSDGGNGSESGDSAQYADTPVKRGRTIYRTDFNGAKGEHPDSDVFDTQHIGPTGLTRQRGPSIDENALISDKNTVMDGNGHLQLFAQKQRTYDPVAKEYVDYTKGSFNTGKDKADNEHGLTFNLKDYPNGIVIETRAMHPKDPGTKFDALWIMTDQWAADPAKGEAKKDTIEYDAAEGGSAGITVHYPVKDSSGKSEDHYGGGAKMNLQDGKYHTYTVAISHKGDVVEYVDGKQAFAKKDVFPTDKNLHLRASLEVSPKWTGKTYTGNGGMNSDGAGYIDYLDVSEMKPN